MTGKMANQEKSKSFEDELRDLEAVVAQIDGGELSLEDSILAFEHGVALVRSLNLKLEEVEKKIEVLMRDNQGALRTTPYRADSGGEDDEEPPF